MKLTLLFLILCLAGTTHAQQPRPIVKRIPAYSATQLMKRVANPDTTYIVNFWATWCPRCMRELQEFETLQKRYNNTTIKVLLVSLDNKEDQRTKLPLFVKSNVSGEVIWLNENDNESYMPQIDTTWTGLLPATLIMRRHAGGRTFLERIITADEIIEKIAAEAPTER